MKKYQTILADPPWNMGLTGLYQTRKMRPAKLVYPNQYRRVGVKVIEKEFIWENSNRAYFKDDSGTVWQIIRTPYKEIPIVVVDFKTKVDFHKER